MRGKSYLPDKEFRYLRHSCYSRSDIARSKARTFLPDSSCRHEDRTVPLPLMAYQRTLGVQSLRIPIARFPADYPHSSHCHRPFPNW
jgi:hypothetical protein